jgi:hypothetical protein
LERLQLSRNLTLNKLKCEFNKTSVEYFGYVFSSQGISPDPRKVETIRNAQPQSNPNEVRCFLGFVNFCARFIPNLATLAKPLRDLTKQNAKWKWTSTEQHAMDSIKSVLTSETTMAYYNPSHKIEVLVDASPVGFGVILVQYPTTRDHSASPRIVSYASRVLTPVETRYSQIEREALAIVWSCHKFHLYLYATQFSVITDHKPL